MQNLTIRPINTGFVGNFPKLYHYHHSTHSFYPGLSDERGTFPVFAFLIEGGDQLVLVDTGMSDTDRAQKYHHASSYQPEGMSIIEQLEKLNILPEDIDVIILTHMHWDHVYYLEKFVNAKIIAHKREYEFALNPIPIYYKSYEYPVLGIEPPFKDLVIDMVEGETEIREGIRVFETFGHSPGHMSVEVETNDGKYIIGGDSAFRLINFNPIPEIFYTVTPPGRYANIVESWKSLEIQKERAESLDKILLTHESSLLERIEMTPVLGL